MTSIPEFDRLDKHTRANVQKWLEGNYSEEVKKEIYCLLKQSLEQVQDAFYTNLSFGTGGLRGIMGIGSNRMNEYTVRAATQGLANYIRKTSKTGTPSMVIGYDSRHHSREFAKEAAKVLAGNGIKVFLFSDLRPVPLVSFACRQYKCQAGIMITASHNPPGYNGYKVYWSYGGQVVSPHDQGIIQEVAKIQELEQIQLAKMDDGLITIIQDEMDKAYLEAMAKLQHYPEENQKYGDELKIVYTSLHGTGITLAPQALAMWGFTNISYVDEQVIPNGDFPTAPYPNPEEKEAMKLGMELMTETDADILIATDPDADRTGVAVHHKGSINLLSGNEIACICAEHVCNALKKQNRMPESGAMIKSIVTSELFAEIARNYNIACFNVLTGFKYIAEMIEDWSSNNESYQFLFGAEESYGYLLGNFCRDKDAITTSALIAEIALHAKRKGQTLIDLMNGIYRKYGVYRDRLLSVSYPETRQGREQMKEALVRLRNNFPKKILGSSVTFIEDLYQSISTKFPSGKTEPVYLPKSDVLRIHLEDDTTLTVRPSGTEPKVKLYCETVTRSVENLAQAKEHCDTLCKDYLQTMKALIS